MAFPKNPQIQNNIFEVLVYNYNRVYNNILVKHKYYFKFNISIFKNVQ